MRWLANLRKWIDGEDGIAAGGEPRPRSKWEDFLVAIAREVDRSMQREMFTPPGGPTYIPREYIVFLSPSDDADWQGEKREGLERGLHHVLSERARELVGEKDFQTRTFTVELRVDATLEPSHFRVQHVWDTQTQKTLVRARKPPAPSPETPTVKLADKSTPDDQATVKRADASQPDEEATVVRSRQPLFSVSVRRKGLDAEAAGPDVRSFFKNEITIGRGSKAIDVDLKLEGDLEVSRKHATLTKGGGGFTIACHGANSIEIGDNREVPIGESAEIKSGEKIVISTFELEVRLAANGR